MREGLDVVLIGQPNVGKSSLLNQLAGDDVAIVTPHAGTTRDAIRSSVEIRGIPLHVIDTAGLRETRRPDRAHRHRAHLGDDRARGPRADRHRRAATSDDGADAAIVARLPAGAAPDRRPQQDRSRGYRTETLAIQAARKKCGFRPRPAQASSCFAMPCSRRPACTRTWRARFSHASATCTRCAIAGTHLDEAARHLQASPPPLELFAEELRGAQQALSAITGEVSADDLLGVIFSRFCIGK